VAQFLHDICIRAHLTSWTGYGQIAEHLGRSLEATGLRVVYEDMGTDTAYLDRVEFVNERIVEHSPLPWILHLSTPDTKPFDGRKRVFFTMWETSRPSPEAVVACNQSEAVVVPCNANAEWFKASGVSRPIHVVPMGVSADEGYFDDGTPPPTDVFRFGMAARMAHGGSRKGLNEGAWAFVDAFPASVTDVCLELKVWEDCLPALHLPDDPRISVVTTPMRPHEMADWYRSLNVLLVPSKGEGWGLHTHQAMACGRPAIAAKWGGTAHFWDARFGWEVPYLLKPAGDFYEGNGQWAAPSHYGMVDALRCAYANRGECLAKGREAAKRAREFTWDRTGRELRGVLEWLGAIGRVRPRPIKWTPEQEREYRKGRTCRCGR